MSVRRARGGRARQAGGDLCIEHAHEVVVVGRHDGCRAGRAPEDVDAVRDAHVAGRHPLAAAAGRMKVFQLQ